MDGRYAFLALGGGVQSSTLAEMVVEGELPRPTAVLFADTGNEAPWTYAHVRYLERRLARVGVPLWRVSAGDLVRDMFDPDRRSQPLPPFFIRVNGRVGRLRRQCTVDYKIEPIRKRLRAFLESKGLARRNASGALYVTPGVQVDLWLGISLDEAERVRGSDAAWIRHVYPLIERRMRRSHCIAWLRERGLPVPGKSACLICPYHENEYWRALRRNHPDLWRRVVDVDRRLRETPDARWRQALHGEGPYIHASCLPLEEALKRLERQKSLFDVSPADACDGGYCLT